MALEDMKIGGYASYLQAGKTRRDSSAERVDGVRQKTFAQHLNSASPVKSAYDRIDIQNRGSGRSGIAEMKQRIQNDVVREVNQKPTTRELDRIRERIQGGTYPVDAEGIARKILGDL